jgi:hypothetical protein
LKWGEALFAENRPFMLKIAVWIPFGRENAGFDAGLRLAGSPARRPPRADVFLGGEDAINRSPKHDADAMDEVSGINYP